MGTSARRGRAVSAIALTAGAMALAAACNALTGVGDLHTTGGSGGGGHGGAAHSSSAGTGGGHAGGGGHGGAASSSSGSGDPCAGVTCSGHGTCSAPMGQPSCTCQAGYHPSGLDCAVDETCTGKSCGTCGACEVQNGVATCTCPMDYAWDGTDCKLAIDPCANANCGPDQFCVPEAHCQALGACVDTCDCSNCPNCGPDNSDGRWNDWQEYCGAQPDQMPATMKCNKPCTGGAGCLPYAVQICWPLEGCFSL
jgi:hypothetical protein